MTYKTELTQILIKSRIPFNNKIHEFQSSHFHFIKKSTKKLT